MKQADFEKKYADFWLRLEKNILMEFKPSVRGNTSVGVKFSDKEDGRLITESKGSFPEDYRLLCHHLSLSRSRNYSPLLIDRLERLVNHAHQLFYKRKSHFNNSLLIYFTCNFPSAIRREWRWITLSSLLFFGTFFGMLITLQYYPDMVYTVIPAEQLAQMESMYDPSQDKIGRNRNSGSDFQMFGFYVFNNTGIGLKTFASGLGFGVGTVITLIFNGLTIGGVAGYLSFIGYGSTFWSFVSGHSAMELTAIVLSGAAGFKLSFAIINPGRKSRLLALRDSAKQAVYIMYGVSMMFIVAAFIEAYWSSMSDIPAIIKYSVGLFNWALLLLYFFFAGRSRG